MLTIKIKTDINGNIVGSAFRDYGKDELARILREYAESLENGGALNRKLYDINGNIVGSAINN